MAKTLSEQVAELERALSERGIAELSQRTDALSRLLSEERERLAYWRGKYHEMREERNAAESALAQARVEGAREALTRYADMYCDAFDQTHMYRFRDREYPASGEEPTRRSRRCPACERHVAVHAKDCPHRPAPPAAPEPLCAVCKGARDVFDYVNHVWTWCRECQSHPPQAMTEPHKHDYVDLMVEESSGGPFVRVKARHIATLLALASRPTASGEG